MASKQKGIVIGTIVAAIAMVLLAYSFMAVDPQPVISETPQDNITDVDSQDHESYINEEGRKVIVIETGDSLSIGE